MTISKANLAAIYCRSSKDRGDVSIDAQRRELQALAASKGLAVAAEFTDAVEQANDTSRPGFKRLVGELRNPAREWRSLLVLDTSRIARDVYLAEVFKREAKKHGVRVLFSKLPEVNPTVDLIVVQVVQAFDQMHSMMSREKGLAGMAENVRQGFRAGGRAPFGYRLEHTATGAIRDGEPVKKSKLVPAEHAATIAQYLKGRSIGRARRILSDELGLPLPMSTLIGIEWQALTYAGHTVWNVHQGRDMHGGYESGVKRRPRSEWQITRNTHEALITDEEAEALLGRLEANPGRRMRGSDYLLSGLLTTPDGRPWHGNAGFYRAGKTNIAAEPLERAVVSKLCGDLSSEAFAAALHRRALEAQQPRALQSELTNLNERLGRLNQQVARVTNLISETTAPRPLIAKLEELETERTKLAAMRDRLKGELDEARQVAELTPEFVRDLLRDIADNAARYPREQLKDLLRGVIAKITVTKTETGAVSACLDYEIPAVAGNKLASPRGFEPLLSP